MRNLAINCGSSSIKCAVIAGERPPHALDLRIENIGSPELPDIAAAIDALFTQLAARAGREFGELDAVAHRIVHGGSEFTGATSHRRSTVAALGKLEAPRPVAQSAGPAGRAARPRVVRAARTARSPSSTRRSTPRCRRARAKYALPEEIRSRFGIRRYGFHGISHAQVALQVAAPCIASRRICASSPATSAMAPASRRSNTAAASRPAWA
jgi:acetate kinase